MCENRHHIFVFRIPRLVVPELARYFGKTRFCIQKGLAFRIPGPLQLGSALRVSVLLGPQNSLDHKPSLVFSDLMVEVTPHPLLWLPRGLCGIRRLPSTASPFATLSWSRLGIQTVRRIVKDHTVPGKIGFTSPVVGTR